MGLRRLLRLWLPVVFWAILIFYLSGIPDLKTGFEFDFLLRKISHVIEYAILVFLLYRAFAGSCENINRLYLFIYPASLTLLYAISDELHQSFVPGRNCSIRDILIDSIGIPVFYFINFIILRKKIKTTF